MPKENIISVFNSIRESYVNYGIYVNTQRHMPYLLDGLKSIYKKVILTALEAKDVEKTSALVGSCLQKYHDHGDASVGPVVSQLVRVGIFTGEGSHGYSTIMGDDLEEAAPRYTKAGLKPEYRELLEALIDYVPTFQNDFGNAEREYIPFPLPISCTFGAMGIGIGTKVVLPAFTPSSMLEAYLRNDYTRLRSTYGYLILTPKELEKIWTTGRGTLRLKMKVYKDVDGGSIIEGNPTEFKPDLSTLMKWRDEKRCIIQDLSTDVPRVKISKPYRLKFPTDDDIFKEADKASERDITYTLRVTFDKKVYQIGLRDWIDITYSNYKELLEKRRLDKIAKCNNEILVYSNFKRIADLIINKKLPDDKIAEKLKLPEWVVNTVSAKSIRTLRDLDPQVYIDKNEKEIREQNQFQPDKYIAGVVSRM